MSSPPPKAAEDRAERLAKALRTNLRRRKAQARAASVADAADAADADPPKDGQ
jgi:hypothetical protein